MAEELQDPVRQEQLNAIFSSMAEGLIAIDNDRKIILMNQAGGILLRTAPQEAIGQDIWVVLLPCLADGRILPDDRLPIERAMTERNIISLDLADDIYLKAKNGRLFPVAMMITPLLTKSGVSGAIILFRDITKEKEVDQAKTEFVSLASHQLKTPLSAINWYSEMMLSEEVGVLNEKQKEYLRQLYESNQRMVGLVNSLLNVSRIDLGTFSIDPEPTKFSEVAESVLAELAPTIKTKNLEVTKSYDAVLPIINADPKLLRIIFQNLLSNAIKYTPASGRIGITLKQEEPNILIQITDSGYGIPASAKNKIFTKLFRAENIRDKEAEGTGLGLYIVRAVVESSGGKIWFDSLEGQGTSFSLTLPLKGMEKRSGAKGLT